MPDEDIQDLIDKHGEETVRKAFWLQERIYEEGLEAARFSAAAKATMRQQGPLLVKRQIEANTMKDY